MKILANAIPLSAFAAIAICGDGANAANPEAKIENTRTGTLPVQDGRSGYASMNGLNMYY
jgi:hypothetical protein